jgi:hypothetical protein
VCVTWLIGQCTVMLEPRQQQQAPHPKLRARLGWHWLCFSASELPSIVASPVCAALCASCCFWVLFHCACLAHTCPSCCPSCCLTVHAACHCVPGPCAEAPWVGLAPTGAGCTVTCVIRNSCQRSLRAGIAPGLDAPDNRCPSAVVGSSIPLFVHHDYSLLTRSLVGAAFASPAVRCPSFPT